jgi:hypothetical protein
MKNLFTLMMVMFITFSVFAQSPQKMSYQAVIRNSSNGLVTSSSVGIRVSILQGSSTGTEIYKEIYNPNPQTNINGLVGLEIGGGIPITGTFSAIDWSAGPYFIKTETDPSGGTNYTVTGTSQLLSVPYALYAKTVSSIPGIVTIDKGGTGASNAADARTNLSLGTLATLSTLGSAEITNGSILGADIASGTINSSNLATGSVASANILDGTIATDDVASIDASKITGITYWKVPVSHGTSGLVDGSIVDNGPSNNVVIGAPGGQGKLSVWNYYTNNTWPIAIQGTYSGTNSTGYGLYGNSNSATAQNTGVRGNASGATGTTSYGVWGYSIGSGTNYAIYGDALNGTANWAGYFSGGNVFIQNQIQAAGLSSATGTTLVLDASGWIRKLSSDSRLKENITPLNNSLERVLKLQGVNFTWKSDSTHTPDIGFVAQDVQKVLPELVIKDNKDGLLSVKYQNMVAVLAEAIKEQQKQIEELKTLVNNLVAKQTVQNNK